jgi:fatty acid desaturase
LDLTDSGIGSLVMAAGHFAVSRRPWVNELVGDWAGLGLTNIGYWEVLHTIA